MKFTNTSAILSIAAAALIMGCNGGDATFTDGSARIITAEGVKTKLAESRGLDSDEKRFVAFHVHDFNVDDWAKILSKPKDEVRGTDVSLFSSSYWTESNFSRAEFQAQLAESDGCTATLLMGSGYEYPYQLPGCTPFNNTNKPDIEISGVNYGLYFYNQIDKPMDWALYSGISVYWQTEQLKKVFGDAKSAIYFYNERLQRGFNLQATIRPENPTSYEPGMIYFLRSPSPVVLEKSSESFYIAHYLENDFISRISSFDQKDRYNINVNVIRVPRIVSVLKYHPDESGDARYSWEKPTHIAYQNASDNRVRDYEHSVGYLKPSAVNGQYVIFMGLEPAKEFAIAKDCRNNKECQTLGSYVLDHVVAHENGHLLMTANHSRDMGHLMYRSIPQTLPVATVGIPFTDENGQRIDRLQLTTKGWTF